ncbi:MAG: LytTR family transcriptional regulator, partial [Donghicola eburneus]
FLFVRYVLPDVLKAIRANRPQEIGDRSLQIGDHSWPLTDISAISSNQHYLQIDFLEGEPVSIRARISDVLNDLPTEAGVQPHRSWWVAAHAHPSLISEGRKRWLVTPFGHKIPVARGRIDDVEKWLNTHGVPEHTTS